VLSEIGEFSFELPSMVKINNNTSLYKEFRERY
jgi:hypothetical protein